MSFRSRSRTVQPIVTRRATSLTRATPLNSSISSPLSSSSYGRSYGSSASNPYSSATSSYSSYSPSTVSSPSGRLNLSSNGTGSHYFDYSNLASRRDSYGSNSSLAYKSPYKDKDRYGNSSSSAYSSSYKDRYVSPYTSAYDNGSSYALKRVNHLTSNGLSGSNGSLNNSSYSPSSYVNKTSTHVGRSQSLREHERRSRSRSRASIASNLPSGSLSRSYSTNSVQSEGYESGTERGRSRVGSTASELADQQKDGSESKENGGDYIDYKALYEQAKADNNKLKSDLRKRDEEVASLQAALERFTVATTKNNSLSELEKREKRAMERKMSEMEEELKLLQKYKTENERLRAENRALTRVVSKLTTSAQNQLHNKQ